MIIDIEPGDIFRTGSCLWQVRGPRKARGIKFPSVYSTLRHPPGFSPCGFDINSLPTIDKDKAITILTSMGWEVQEKLAPEEPFLCTHGVVREIDRGLVSYIGTYEQCRKFIDFAYSNTSSNAKIVRLKFE